MNKARRTEITSGRRTLSVVPGPSSADVTIILEQGPGRVATAVLNSVERWRLVKALGGETE